jgi:excisionase family DNA binding protein
VALHAATWRFLVAAGLDSVRAQDVPLRIGEDQRSPGPGCTHVHAAADRCRRQVFTGRQHGGTAIKPAPENDCADVVLLTVDDVGERLRQSRRTVYKLISTGALPSITLGASRRVPSSALTAYIASLISASEATQDVIAP